MRSLPRFLLTFLLGACLVPGWTVLGQRVPSHVLNQLERESSGRRSDHDNHQAAAKYWYASRNPKHLDDMDEALEELLPAARKVSPYVAGFMSWEIAHQYKPYHDAGAILLAKAYTLLYYGDVSKAAPVIDLIEREFPYAMMLEDDRSCIRVRYNLRYHEHCCMLYSAMGLEDVKANIFLPKERDEFDGPMQREALEDMAILRLREANFDRLEHLFAMVDHSGLQTSSGRWGIDIIMSAMCPHDREAHSESAWLETRNMLRLWQKAKLRSDFPRLAEARFWFHYGLFHAGDGFTALATLRECSEKGLELLRQVPRDSPAWYDTMIRLQVMNGQPIEKIAPVFREGLRKFPGYAPLVIALGRGFVELGESGREICCGMVGELEKEGKADAAAQLLCAILRDGDLHLIQPRLDVEICVKTIRAAFEHWPDSYELRSQLSLLAVTLGRKDVARDLLKGMEGKWCPQTWRGKEDIVIALIKETQPPEVARPVVKNL